MKILFFDLETTGFPKRMGNDYYPFIQVEKFDSSRIVQIAWQIYDDGKLIKTQNHIIKPSFIIPQESTLFHKITNEIANDIGLEIDTVFNELYSDLLDVTSICAHNIKFDKSILLSELHRKKCEEIIVELLKKTEICTWKIAKIVMGRNKNTKLCDFYRWCFGEDVNTEEQHNALYDVINMVKCYYSDKTQNIIKI